jgi:TolB-like protein
VFDLLDYLIGNMDRVVSKDELLNAVWNGRIVSDAALTTRLNAARCAIGDSGEEQRLIKTLPRKGFRFVGQVREAREVAGPNPGDAPEIAPAVPDKPSIAVLPFQNMSDDPGQEHFTDGIVQEIITGLSRMRWLSVVARNSSFVYRGRSVDVKQIGRELGVRYVLEGSVRKAGNRVRITGQLIDSITGVHLWADHFDGGLEDVFDLQDKVTANVVGAIEPTVIEAEIERTKRTPAASPYDYIARGFASQRTWSREANAEALRLFRQALQLDPSLGVAYVLASQCYTWGKSLGWLTDPASETAEGARLARRALELGRNDPPILTMAGFAIAYLEGGLDFGGAAIERALELNPNYAGALGPQRLDQGFPRGARPRHRAPPARHATEPSRSADVRVAERRRLRAFFFRPLRGCPVVRGKGAAGASGVPSSRTDDRGQRRAGRSARTIGDLGGPLARTRADPAHFESQGSDPVSPARRPRQIGGWLAQGRAPGVSLRHGRLTGGPNLVERDRQAALYVRRILEGEKPADPRTTDEQNSSWSSI